MSKEIQQDVMKISFDLYDYETNHISHTQDNLSEYESIVLDRINLTQSNFAQSGKCDIKEIVEIFAYIASVGCGFFYPSFKFYGMGRYPIYPLPNLTGHFGLNTYIYAFLEGIELIGVPLKVSTFDNLWGCPLQFMNHDVRHVRDIESELSNRNSKIRRIKHVYNTIINDSNLSDLQKQCIILYMWIDIHELVDIKYYTKGEWTPGLTPAFIKSSGLVGLLMETKKFTDFTHSSENLLSLNAYLLSHPDVSIDPSEWYARQYMTPIILSQRQK